MYKDNEHTNHFCVCLSIRLKVFVIGSASNRNPLSVCDFTVLQCSSFFSRSFCWYPGIQVCRYSSGIHFGWIEECWDGGPDSRSRQSYVVRVECLPNCRLVSVSLVVGENWVWCREFRNGDMWLYLSHSNCDEMKQSWLSIVGPRNGPQLSYACRSDNVVLWAHQNSLLNPFMFS